MRYVVSRTGTLLSAVAGNAAEALRTTASVNCEGASRFRWTAVLTRVAASAMTIQVYASVDGGTTWGLIQSQAVSGGTATLSDYIQSKASAGNLSIDGWVDCLGATNVKAIVSATGGGADDKLTFIGALAELRG